LISYAANGSESPGRCGQGLQSIVLRRTLAQVLQAAAAWGGIAFAQDATIPTPSNGPQEAQVQPQAETQPQLNQVTIVGTRLPGASAPALPVTVLTTDDIRATGAVSGDDLLRTVPSMGDVTFNPANGQQTDNSARGDVASIDLRGAGVGATLVLLNGRRVVAYPTSQSKGGVPLIAYNADALPVASLDRLEILRDGAGAIYGSDAVAGVVNAVTTTHFEGVTVSEEYGGAEDTHLRQSSTSILAGQDFAGTAGNVTLSLDLTQRSAELSGDQPYTATQDLRTLFASAPGYSTSSAPDGRSTESSWPTLVAVGVVGPVMQGTVPLTTSAGTFHIQPASLPGCRTQIGSGLCIGSGAVPYSGAANSLLYDAAANNALTDSPAVHRQIAELNASFDVSPRLTLYSEFDYYHATSYGLTTEPTTLVPVGVPASNFYNPFGSAMLPNGTANPNRLPNLTNVPATGIPVTFTSYRFNDLGPDPVSVAADQSRYLVGARGILAGFAWDSALYYGSAEDVDTTRAVSSAALAQQLALSTPAAYDPFNGSCLNGAGGGDCTPSAEAALQAIEMNLRRVSRSTLTSADFKLAKPALFDLPAGGIAIATGVEARLETHEDIRAPAVNGSEPFTDPVTGLVSASSATGVNVTPSTSGSRNVASAYLELGIPVVAPTMSLPLARAISFQMAGRYEHYSDFGSVAKPRLAVDWETVRGVRLRASYEQGFEAPNLETTAPFTYARAQSVTDDYRCEADLLTHKIPSFDACTDKVIVAYQESGNPALQAERSASHSFGIAFEPPGLSEPFEKLTLTVDYWQLRQYSVVGVLGAQALSAQDYLNRIEGGSGSANIVRGTPTADDVAEFAGSGLAPVGLITQIDDRFENVQPETISGIDYQLLWRATTARRGTFLFSVEATTLNEFNQPAPTPLQPLYMARASGIINPATVLPVFGNMLEDLGNPRIKSNATLTWTLDHLQLGASIIYTGKTKDTNLVSTSGVPWPVSSMTVINLYGDVALGEGFGAHSPRLTLGARNLFNRSPPLESDGYNAALYVPYGRYIYAKLSVPL